MNVSKVTLQQMELLFEAIKFQVSDLETSRNFLSEIKIDKANDSRYLSWMIVLDIIPSDSVLWPQTFYHILKSYRGKMKYYGQEIRQLLAEKSY